MLVVGVLSISVISRQEVLIFSMFLNDKFPYGDGIPC